MKLKKLVFWTGVLVGMGVGYAVAISLPEEQRQALREKLVARGEEVVEKLKETGSEQAREWAQEVRRKAEEWVEQAPEVADFIRVGTNGASREGSM